MGEYSSGLSPYEILEMIWFEVFVCVFGSDIQSVKKNWDLFKVFDR